MKRLSESGVKRIGQALQFNIPLGNCQFKEEIERYLGRTIGGINGGRPAHP